MQEQTTNMIPTLQLGQTGQASNLGPIAWRGVGTSAMSWTTSTDYVLNLTQNERDAGNNQPNPDKDTLSLPYSGWYAISGAYRMSSYPSTAGYNSTTLSAGGSQPIGWHENHMTTGYFPGKMVFAVCYAPAGTVVQLSGNQYSSSTMTVTANTINLATLGLHNNMTPYGVDLIGAGTSLTTAISTPLTYTTANRDDGTFWNGGSETIMTVPLGGAGWYAMSGWYRLLNPGNGVGGARSWWLVNGTLQLQGSSTPCDNGSKSPPAAALYYLNEGDYVQFIADQNVGATRTTERHRVGLTRVATTNGVHVSRSTAQSVASTATELASFDTEDRDDSGAWTISDPTKLTVPSGGTGWYIICGSTYWQALTGWDRELILIVDGTTEISRMEQYAPAQHNDPRLCVATIYYLTEGQYVQLQLRNGHTSTAANTTAGTLRFAMVKVDIG
jgi:hypothetical protein